MSRLELRPFRGEDYLTIVREPYVQPTFLLDPAQAQLDARALQEAGRGRTGWLGAHIAACAGIMRHWEGLGIAWAVVTTRGRHEAGPAIHRAVRVGLHAFAREMGLRRVEASVRADFAVGRRWVRLLGFHEESVMPRYGPNGEAHVKVVWFPNGGPPHE